MRGGGALIGMMVVAGCAAPHAFGVVPLDPGSYGLTVTSRSLGAAAELALGEATGFCARQGEQTQLLRTRINPGDYQVVFRCVGAVPLAGRRGPSGDDGGPAPQDAPILRGQAFATQAAVPLPRAVPPAAPPPGYAAGLGPSGLPVVPPTLGALRAVARPVPPREEPVFAPMPSSALLPVAAPRSFEGLPSVTGLPGGPPPRALTPLPPIGEPPLGFWDLRRN